MCWRACRDPLSGQEVIDSVLLTDVSDCHYYYFCSSLLCESSRCSVVHLHPASVFMPPLYPEGGILMGLRGVLLVCCQLLPVPAVQIHAKLSSSQVCRQKEEHFYFSSFCFYFRLTWRGPFFLVGSTKLLLNYSFKLFYFGGGVQMASEFQSAQHLPVICQLLGSQKFL